jgi:hypothetical protein
MAEAAERLLLHDFRSLSDVLLAAERSAPVDSNEKVLGLDVIQERFVCPEGEFELWYHRSRNNIILRWTLKRHANSFVGDGTLASSLADMRSIQSREPVTLPQPVPNYLFGETLTWRAAAIEQIGGHWIPTESTLQVSRREPWGESDITLARTLISTKPVPPEHDAFDELAKAIHDGTEVAYSVDGKSDGLYREWRDGKPVVVERPKVQETIDEAVQQVPAVTRPPDSSRTQLYLLLGGAALLIALAVALSWYHARSRR